jgi:hypothetical protein
MLKVLDETRSDLLALRISGRIEGNDIEKMNPLLEKMLKDYEKPKVYVEIDELDMPTAKAVWEDLKNTPKYNKFGKCAVVGSKEWHEVVAKLSGSILGPEVKYFNFDEKTEAMAWLKSVN